MKTVESLLLEKNIEFKPSGADLVVRCLNPDHEDKNPSMRINQTTGVFNCLSCGFSGNIFRHFNEKVDFLDLRRTRLLSIISDKLMETSGLQLPENAVFFDTTWRNISADTFIKFQAFQHNSKEFIGRVVFPIKDVTGKIVAFIGRHQGQADPKYLVYPPKAKMPFFPVSKPYNGDLILVEGIFDMLNLYDKGLTNVSTTFGTKNITVDKLKLLKIQGVSSITVLFDKDDAGKKAADEVLALCEKAELAARKYNLETVKDPGELTAQQVIRLKEILYNA